VSGSFDSWTDRDIVDLIEQHPFAWLVSCGGRFRATPLPILVELDQSGRPVSLLGHFAKSNPQVDMIRAQPTTLFLFSGPHGYISPELLSSRDWGPTCNYAVARITAEVGFDAGLNDEVLARLVNKMESGRAKPWNVAELGPRYEQLKKQIIAFRAPIVSTEARFKLGQDESSEVLAEILTGLDDDALKAWMRRFNAARG
jgi:transcriptional regulator